MTTQALIKFLADGLLIPVVLISIYSLLFHIPHRRKYDSYCRIIIVGLTSLLFAKLLGLAIQPASMRPFELLGVSAGASFMDNPGFPSDHALFASFLSLAVLFETGRKRLALLLFGFTLLIGVGRILALVHTPLDVIGGVVIAAMGSVWYFQSASYTTKLAYRQKRKKLVQ